MKSKNDVLSNLEAQKITALSRGDTKTAKLIQNIINLIENKDRKSKK
jgi:hypothetical protein